MSKISIVIPVYNTDKYLARCLSSLINQTYSQIEIIIVNDGSTDNSQAIIDSFISMYPNKIYAFYQNNAGQSVARNNGILHASGEYLTFVDSDDWLEINALELMYQSAVNFSSDIVVCDINCYSSDTPHKINFLSRFKANKYLAQKFVCGKLYRIKFWRDNNFRFYEGIYYEDLELTPKILFMTNNISIVDQRLYNYELRNATSTTNMVSNYEYFKLIFDQLITFYNDKKDDQLFEQELCNSMFGFFMSYDKSSKLTEEIFKDNHKLLKIRNGINNYQKILIILIKCGVPLKVLFSILKIRKKIKYFIRK